MAGITEENYKGEGEVKTVEVASIDPSGSAPIVEGGHVEGNGGPEYNENPGVDVTTKPYPAGTAMTDSTPGDNVN